MTATRELATIEKVDIREVWENEARDFTPWLAHNLSALGKASGLDLELQTQEASVGGYSLDILARDVGNGRPWSSKTNSDQLTTRTSANCSHMRRDSMLTS